MVVILERVSLRRVKRQVSAAIESLPRVRVREFTDASMLAGGSWVSDGPVATEVRVQCYLGI